MKFKMNGELDFEARNPDEALLKLGLYFIAQMENPPQMGLHNESDPTQPDIMLDVMGMLADKLKVITPVNSTGYVSVFGQGVFVTPEMMQ